MADNVDTHETHPVQTHIHSITQEIQYLLGSGDWGKMLTSLAGWGIMWNYFYAICLFLLTTISLIIHTHQVWVGQVCKPGDDIATCLKQGGMFRAMNFTAESTRLSFTTYPAGSITGFDGTRTEVALNPFVVKTSDTAPTPWHLSSSCAANLTGSDINEQTQCEASNIRAMYQIPNGLESQQLSGAVHIFFFLWFSMYLATAFAVIMIPGTIAGSKPYILLAWYVVGFIMTIMMLMQDKYFNMRVPHINILIAFLLMLFTAFINYIWIVDYGKAEKKTTYKRNKVVPGPIEPNPMEVASKNSGLHSLMRMPAFTEGHSYTPLEANYNGFRRAPLAVEEEPAFYDFDVFSTKLSQNEIMEPLYVDCAITIPACLVAVYCIGQRNPIDFFVQSIYVRSFMFFITCAAIERIRGLSRFDYYGEFSPSAEDTEENNENRRRAHTQNQDKNKLSILSTTSAVSFVILFISGVAMFYMLSDWYSFIKVQIIDNAALGFGGTRDVVMGTFILTIFICAVPFLFQVGTPIAAMRRMYMDPRQYLTSYMTTTFLLFTLRIFLFVYMVAPHKWYGAYDKNDILLNYD